MAYLSTASSSSLVYNRSRRFHVFISFRGEDTRNNIVSHLYPLEKSGIDTFKDDEKLEKGVSVKLGLFEAITQSELSIIVISENYASSTWCLEELSKILECRKIRGQKIVPIFYNVDPSDARNQRGSFANAFAKHEEKFKHDKEKVNKWKKALHKVANISGHDSRGRNESRLIKEIIDDISYKNHCMESVASGLVGMDPIMEEIDELLALGSNDVRMLGICGMAGIGKTTIVEAVFERISCQFEARCFLHKVKEEFHKSNKSALLLQEKLLYKISQITKISFETEIEGRQQIQNRCSHRKILIVVDDVDNLQQLQELVGSCDWFGSGSRIIITTRDRHLLVQHDVQLIYEARELDTRDAIQLFCQHAFKKEHPTSELQELSNQIIGYCQGLPLALKVLGSLMCGRRSKHEWEDEIKKLKRSPDLGIQKVLKSCIDGLDDRQKELFLDIACLFNGWCKALVEKVLDALSIDMSILVDRSLITIVQKNDSEIELNMPQFFDYEKYVKVIRMHDLLQEMGREVVRQESKGKLENQTLFFDYEDVHNLFTINKGTNKIRGISLYLDKSEDGLKEIHPCQNAFAVMGNLKFLNLRVSSLEESKVLLCAGSIFLPPSLRYLHWHGCPFSQLSSKSNFENLVVLEMTHSPIKRLWKGVKCLKNLIILNLSNCQNLERVPNLCQAPNLERLILKGCSNLVEIHWSVGHLDNIRVLNLNGCSKLKDLSWLNGRKGTHKIHVLPHRLKLNKFPATSGKTKSLIELRLDGTYVKELPSVVENFESLEILSLRDCMRLECLTGNVFKLKSLRKLDLTRCSKLSTFPEVSETMPNLWDLELGGSGITTLPDSIRKLESVEILGMMGCLKLASLPNIYDMRALRGIYLGGMPMLSFPILEDYFSNSSAIEVCNRSVQRLRRSLSNSFQRHQEILRNHSCRSDFVANILQRLSNSESHLKRMLKELKIYLNQLPSPWRPFPYYIHSGWQNLEHYIFISLTPFLDQSAYLTVTCNERGELLDHLYYNITDGVSSPENKIRLLSTGGREAVVRMLQIISDLVDQSTFERWKLQFPFIKPPVNELTPDWELGTLWEAVLAEFVDCIFSAHLDRSAFDEVLHHEAC